MRSSFFTLTLALFLTPTAWAYQGSPMPTGNGYGFAVVEPSGELTKLYAHPYRYEHPKPNKPKSQGIKTANFIKSASWQAGQAATGTVKATYVSQSQIISVSDGTVTANYFEPFGLAQNVLVTYATVAAAASASDVAVAAAPAQACLNVTWSNAVVGKTTVAAATTNAFVFQLKGVPELLAAIPFSSTGTISGSTSFCGSDWAFVVLPTADQASTAIQSFETWRAGATGEQLAKRELHDLEKWRVKPPFSFNNAAERNVWRQNEVILRMAQILEPLTPTQRSYGLILASLPEGEWFIPWVRDMSYSTVALIRSGHRAEAKLALSAYMNAGPIGLLQSQLRGFPYQISTVRYFGDGSEQSDYSGLPERNMEIDDWGLALWALGEYFDKYQDVSFLQSPGAHGTVYETARDYVVTPLLGNLDPAGDGQIVTLDTSIWEQNDAPYMHYAFSTLAAINGLRRFLPLAQAMGDDATVAQIKKEVPLLEKGFAAAFVVDGDVHGTVENSPRNEMDGAVVEGLNWHVIKDPALVKSTLNRMSILLAASGGYRRVTGTSGYELQEFLYINFNLARFYLRQGQFQQANQIVDRMVNKAVADNGLIPELYISTPTSDYPGTIGDPSGSIPMVGYGAGVYTIFLSERQQLQAAW